MQGDAWSCTEMQEGAKEILEKELTSLFPFRLSPRRGARGMTPCLVCPALPSHGRFLRSDPPRSTMGIGKAINAR
jgi:hypothetical protein